MARDITSGFQTEIEADQLHPIYLFKAEFDGGDVRFWTGIGELTYDSEVYTGSGDLLRFDPVTETQELTANGAVFRLSGLPSSIVSIALSEPYQGRPVTAWQAVLDNNFALIADPYQVFKGNMDIMTISDNGSEAEILLSAESELVVLTQSIERRYTPEDQKQDYPNDLGLDFVPLIQDIELTFGSGRED